MTTKTDNTAQLSRRRKRPVRFPPDREPLLRWQGDGLALLTRLQELFGELWMANDALGVGPKTLPAEDFLRVAKLIGGTVEHFRRMPR